MQVVIQRVTSCNVIGRVTHHHTTVRFNTLLRDTARHKSVSADRTLVRITWHTRHSIPRGPRKANNRLLRMDKLLDVAQDVPPTTPEAVVELKTAVAVVNHYEAPVPRRMHRDKSDVVGCNTYTVRSLGALAQGQPRWCREEEPSRRPQVREMNTKLFNQGHNCIYLERSKGLLRRNARDRT